MSALKLIACALLIAQVFSQVNGYIPFRGPCNPSQAGQCQPPFECNYRTSTCEHFRYKRAAEGAEQNVENPGNV